LEEEVFKLKNDAVQNAKDLALHKEEINIVKIALKKLGKCNG
jgi:hypothetical protein